MPASLALEQERAHGVARIAQLDDLVRIGAGLVDRDEPEAPETQRVRPRIARLRLLGTTYASVKLPGHGGCLLQQPGQFGNARFRTPRGPRSCQNGTVPRAMHG